jgi:multicomponent Na+:H+ antiporter subunit F
MGNFLLATAGFVLTMVALGLLRIFYGPAAADRMMAAQLIGTGGVAVLLLLAVGTEAPPVVDVALLLALLAAFASAAFIRTARPEVKAPEATDRR